RLRFRIRPNKRTAIRTPTKMGLKPRENRADIQRDPARRAMLRAGWTKFHSRSRTRRSQRRRRPRRLRRRHDKIRSACLAGRRSLAGNRELESESRWKRVTMGGKWRVAHAAFATNAAFLPVSERRDAPKTNAWRSWRKISSHLESIGCNISPVPASLSFLLTQNGQSPTVSGFKTLGLKMPRVQQRAG